MIQTIEYQDHQIYTLTEGNGEVIIFLHGWPTNSRLWKSQVETLKTDYKVITLDWLGFGKSDKPTENKYTFTKKKEILDAVLSVLLKRHEKVTIVAHDIGGPPAIIWASENEERVKQLILLNTIIYPFKTITDALSEILLSIPLLKDIFVSQFGLRLVMKTNTKSGDKAINKKIEDILEVYKNVKNTIKWKTLLEPLREGRKNEIHSISEKFRDLRIKKYLVIAKDDPLCYAHIKKLSIENPNVPAYYIKGCGHFIPIDKPNALNEILIKILKGEDGS